MAETEDPKQAEAATETPTDQTAEELKDVVEEAEDFEAKVMDADAATEENIEPAEENPGEAKATEQEEVAEASPEGTAEAETQEDEAKPEAEASEGEESPAEEPEDPEAIKAAKAEARRERLAKFEKYQTKPKSFVDFLKTTFLKVFGITFVLCFACLFYFIAVEITHEEAKLALEGYVKVNHKLPADFKGEAPEHIQEIIDNYNKKHHKKPTNLDYLFHAKDEANMGEQFPERLSNDDLVLVLEYQKIGKVTRAGAENTAKMNLSGLDMRSLNYGYLKSFVQSNLRKANMSGITNQYAEFRAASMEKAIFDGAHLEHGNFIRAKMNHASFVRTNMNHSDFRQAKSIEGKLSYANLSNSNLRHTNFKHADFAHAIIQNSNFKDSTLEGANFSNADLSGTDFSRSDLSGADFSGANLTNVNFKNAKLDSANFVGADLHGANFHDAKVQEADLYGVFGATQEQLEQAKFLIGAKRLPDDLVENRRSWRVRF